VKTRLVTSLREFDALAPVWESVTAASNQRSPFASHDWFATCWRTAGPDRQREVWVLEDGAGPVALLPLVRFRERRRGFPVRVIQFLDSPDTAYAEFPVARDIDEVLSTILTALAARSDWDKLVLPKVRQDGGLFKALGSVLSGQFPWRVAATERSPYVATVGTWQQFLADHTQRFRKTCRSIENRMERSGRITVEEHDRVEPDAPIFAEVLHVSEESWKGPRGVAMATMLGMPRFFQELTRRASANGSLHLWLLRLDGRPVATEYQLQGNGVVHALRADFDATLAASSPGAYLNIQIIRALFARPTVHQYDMGPGTNEYKLRWATGAHDLASVEVFAPTRYGRLLHGLETRVVPMARRWRDRLRNRCE
jgi:CelD/BcsL family acetyltransferase involved in cellulose biosynthesis